MWIKASQLWKPVIVHQRLIGMPRDCSFFFVHWKHASLFVNQQSGWAIWHIIIPFKIASNIPSKAIAWICWISLVSFVTNQLDPPTEFNTLDYISFSLYSIQSGSTHQPNHSCFFNITSHLLPLSSPLLWTSLQLMDLDLLALPSIKSKLRQHLWSHFIIHFDEQNPSTSHF